MRESAERVRALGGAPWPGTDAAEAHLAALGELGAEHWPVLPELPDRGPGADATGRSAALLAEISVDLQPHGWRVSPPSAVASGMDRRRARSYWREDAQRWADTAGAEGADVPRLTVRVRGPLTLLGELWLPGGERALVDAGARRDLAEAYRVGLGEALAGLRRTTGAARLGVLLDEPRAAAVLAGELATASGFRTVRSLPRDEARGVWRQALTDLVDDGVAQVWLDPHAGEGHVRELALLAAESLPVRDGDRRGDVGPEGESPDAEAAPPRTRVGIVLDAGPLDGPGATPRAWDLAAGWREAGRDVVLRPAAVGPERHAAQGQAPRRTTIVSPAAVVETWDRLGLDPALARGLTLTAPGMHTTSVLARLRSAADELDARVLELGG